MLFKKNGPAGPFFVYFCVMRIDDLFARLKEYREWVSLAEKQTGKSLLSQAREIRALKHAGGQCGITDYYWFRLYDENYLSGEGQADFLGWRLQDPFNFALNPRHAVLPAWDKLVFHQLAQAAGLPLAPIIAYFHPAKKLVLPGCRKLSTLESAAEFLREEAEYPIYAKPAYSQQGEGALALLGYRREDDTLQLAGDRTIPLPTFVRRLHETVDRRYHRPECGFLFQQILRNAPEIEKLTGWPAISGIRLICLNGPEGVFPVAAAWKIAVPPNTVDNFHMGAYGNLVAGVDITTGKVERVVDGFWPKARLNEQHPLTGQSFAGFCLPGWQAMLDVCEEAGKVFPLMKVHHWDFALTDRGPVILELNDMGGTQIVQLHGRGLLKRETREFLKRHADRQVHRWVNDL
ncbi:sugar-transfer associated ATP-grasp domain-containing protein [Sulfuricystis multivorans]|uniref:sugar-transfer associated ATP-grasp domain-containing protein n=1 Tax=Sulfuricystis multivorans TaxID=2211108 RepID=UPI000F83BCCC|nr:sugar-transfer associated ATP-grasp domain-containing protein [Sulfuricystis multivorans]